MVSHSFHQNNNSSRIKLHSGRLARLSTSPCHKKEARKNLENVAYFRMVQATLTVEALVSDHLGYSEEWPQLEQGKNGLSS